MSSPGRRAPASRSTTSGRRRLGGFTLREYALSGASDLIETERELRRLEEAMAAGDHGPETLRRYGEAQARLEHAGGYGWRDHATAVLRGLGSRTATSTGGSTPSPAES